MVLAGSAAQRRALERASLGSNMRARADSKIHGKIRSVKKRIRQDDICLCRSLPGANFEQVAHGEYERDDQSWFQIGLDLRSDWRFVVSMGRENEEEDSPHRAIDAHGFFENQLC
ncbi:hypothetical protein CUMW_102670 [Citrus unshiu]|uniref:Uncharacterized protein n=1 Tax=Citrus sinensis TaxID=2711 RepID=A0A067F5B9_CITSI|nr:hypothetical protein CISIN_1g046548mg [Citrus sinensis]GAY47180.1 hypothetical protein CUMW_102670 [Citrus unshiu]